MFLAAFPTGAFEANCYVLATGPDAECVVVDPGEGAFATVDEICSDNGLTPVAVCATHGHLDHIADAARVCEHWQVPCWIHPADQQLLTEPLAGLPAQWRPAVEELIGGTTLPAPARVEPYGHSLALAGLEFEVTHAPGHSPGSVVLRVSPTDPATDTPDRDAGDHAQPPTTVVLSGDVIFAGSIGRTDLPGGDLDTMTRTLTRLMAALPPDAVLLPGHGPRTTMAAELASNPYLPRAGTG